MHSKRGELRCVIKDYQGEALARWTEQMRAGLIEDDHSGVAETHDEGIWPVHRTLCKAKRRQKWQATTRLRLYVRSGIAQTCSVALSNHSPTSHLQSE